MLIAQQNNNFYWLSGSHYKDLSLKDKGKWRRNSKSHTPECVYNQKHKVHYNITISFRPFKIT